MIYESHGVPPPDLSTNWSDKPLLLDSIEHLGPVWKDIGHVLTTKLPDWFDAQVSHHDILHMRTLMKVHIHYSSMIIVHTGQQFLPLLTSRGSDIPTTHLSMSGQGPSSCYGMIHRVFPSRGVRQLFIKRVSFSGLNTSAKEPVPWHPIHLTLRQSPIKTFEAHRVTPNVKTAGNDAQLK
jgi:hypothetical protein